MPRGKEKFRALSLNNALHVVMGINSDYLWKPQEGERSMGSALKSGRFCNPCSLLLNLSMFGGGGQELLFIGM